METTKGDKINNRSDPSPTKKGHLKEGSPNAVAVTVPRQNDIILGRGKGAQNHPGNRIMRKTLTQYWKRYVEAKHGVKQCVVKEAYHELVQGDIRFLKRDENDHWVLVDKETALLKVGHCLRGATRKEQRPQLKPQAQTANINSCDEGASRQDRSGTRGDERVSGGQHQSGILGECSTDELSLVPPPFGNLYGPSIPSPGSISQSLLWQGMQNQYPIARQELPGRSSLQIPNIFSRAEFLRAHSSVSATPAVDAVHLALRDEIMKELQRAQMMGAVLPY
ncbi:unnamed protein product [Cylindrotheca closterium]|uniref:DUF6824 domain-containing protein n=1 Tax=Cylindrotheca closterium TaxID=2856 RepID=A0AAD2FW57_9STRA|nr:unnamed protein product [Cylindrotheca closterium]